MSDALDEFLRNLGYGGAQTGADIARILDIQDPTIRRLAGKELDPLFEIVRTGLGELPGLLSALTGQAQKRFQVARGGIQERGVELGRAGRAGVARAGFAGAGAPQRLQRIGRRQLGQQFMGVLGAREAGMFGGEQRVETERAGLLGQMGTGIQNLLRTLMAGDVQFEGAAAGEDTTIDLTALRSEYNQYVMNQAYQGVTDYLSFEEWLEEEGY